MSMVFLMKLVFWLSVAVTLYVYVGYPALMAIWARLAPRPVRRLPITPRISIVIAARNEADTIDRRLANLLSLDYPRDAMQIVVVSDGSTDATADILASYGSSIDVILLPPGGKARALNAGVAAARHEVLVFADARQTFAPDALRALVEPFADPAVGGVSGELLLDCESGEGTSTIGEGVGAYWRYEKWLRRQESLVGSTLGSTGAIHAIRRDLWKPLPPETILDDVLAPMDVVLAGARVVFEGRARAFDRAASNGSAEFARKTRTLAGNYQLVMLRPRLLLPFANPVWLQFVSHKLGRLVAPYALLGIFVSSIALAAQERLFAAALGAQIVFYGLAAYGAVLDRRDRAVAADDAAAALDASTQAPNARSGAKVSA